MTFHFARVANPDAEHFAKPGTAWPTRRVWRNSKTNSVVDRQPAVTTPSIGAFGFFASFAMNGDALTADGSRTW